MMVFQQQGVCGEGLVVGGRVASGSGQQGLPGTSRIASESCVACFQVALLFVLIWCLFLKNSLMFSVFLVFWPSRPTVYLAKRRSEIC